MYLMGSISLLFYIVKQVFPQETVSETAILGMLYEL